MMKVFFLLVNVAAAFHLNPHQSDLIEIGEEKDIIEANKDLINDDILEPDETQRSSINNVEKLWTSPVPYVLDKSLEMNAKGVVLRSMDQFRIKSCIDFRPKNTEDKYFISIEKQSGCYSYVGRVFSGGQVLSIGRYCDSVAIAEHEFLHALGFYHEQSRFDRDEHVEIKFENILEGRESNFRKKSEDMAGVQGVPYDYLSVMHYGPNAFTNGNGSTIVTKNPAFQDLIGQRREMSPRDVQELNLRYSCNSTVAFQMFCDFSNESTCHMTRCSRSHMTWEKVTKAAGGPGSDHTHQAAGGPGSNHTHPAPGGPGSDGYMHASTAFGGDGDSALFQTSRIRTSRTCRVQCLQFYLYHSGNESDKLNIWIREFRHEQDVTGKARLMAQISGEPASHWQLQHVSLDAGRLFQVEFEAVKGPGESSGGFSIDDVNLSEVECPHVTLHIQDFEKVLGASRYFTRIYSPRHYSSGGYAYRVGVQLFRTYFGCFVQLLSGEHDDKLQFPVAHRQWTCQVVDQNPDIRLQMSKQLSLTSDPDLTQNGEYVWDDPRKTGNTIVDQNNETIYVGRVIGRTYLANLKEMKTRDFLKGGNLIFTFSFQDISPLVNGSALPCPRVPPVKISASHGGSCSSRTRSSTFPPATTDRTTTSSFPPTTDDSIFGFSPALVSSPFLMMFIIVRIIISM